MEIQYRLEHIGITVDDLEKSVEWYKTNLGFQEVRRFDKPSLQLKGALMRLENSFLEILNPYTEQRKESGEKDEKRVNLQELLKRLGTNHIALNVNDVDESYNKLKQNNVEFVTEILESRYFFCKDINGVLIEVRQMV